MSEKKLLRLNVVARILELSEGTLRLWARQGKLEFVIVNHNKEKRIPDTELERLRKERGDYIALYSCVPYPRRSELPEHEHQLADWAATHRPGTKTRIFSEIGLTSQGNRRKFRYLLSQVAEKKVLEIVCLYPDCFFLGEWDFLGPILGTVGCQVTFVFPDTFFSTPDQVARAITNTFAAFVKPKINDKKTKSEIQAILLKNIE